MNTLAGFLVSYSLAPGTSRLSDQASETCLKDCPLKQQSLAACSVCVRGCKMALINNFQTEANFDALLYFMKENFKMSQILTPNSQNHSRQ